MIKMVSMDLDETLLTTDKVITESFESFVKKLKSKKKYYFKVRCSKTVKGHTYYSAYSKIKSIKIK